MKIALMILWILSLVIAVGSIPASILWFEIPEYFTVIFATAIVIFAAGCIRIISKRKKRIAVIISSVVVILISAFGNYCNPYWNYSVTYSETMDTVLTNREAVEDLECVMKHLKKCHPAFYHGIPEEVEVRYQEVLKQLGGTETVTVCWLSQKAEYICSVLRDGHTYVKENPEVRHYMKDIYKFQKENAQLVAINGLDMKKLLEQTKELYSYEAESWQLHMLKNDLSSAEGLMFLGIYTDAGVEYTYEHADGTRESNTYHTADFLTYDDYVSYNNIEQASDKEESFVSFEIDEDKSLAILTLTSCNYNKEYKDCLLRMFREVKEKNIQNVAVDLRDNGGGNSLVVNEFIRYLNVESFEQGTNDWRWGCFMIPFHQSTVKNKKYEELLFEGEVYVLTSSASFSSAMLFAQWMVDNDLGTLIGEAPGNDPNGYGDVTMFTLPNSKLFLQTSTKVFCRADKDNPDDLVEPDISCDANEAMEVLFEEISK
ncbi:MAG: hypothetical protein IJZ76_09660 [Lachnospiraceae bacterium]|nr:hypothetical protein [Lachnospiraceae bacterium]